MNSLFVSMMTSLGVTIDVTKRQNKANRDRGPVARAHLPHHLACGSGGVVKHTVARRRFVSWKQALSMPSID